MEPIYLFDLASTQQNWLATRQAVVAQNIANANTPGYVAKEVAPFKNVYDQTQLDLVSTSPGHMALDPLNADDATKDASPWEVVPSGNSVSMEREMLKANEVSREYSMNTAIVKAFAQMYTVSVKGS
ncbi:flagellar basal body rod protein FlgB [Methylovirgula ligni]|uniref:Flagellar basal-body rod protein FlgB n=1 Tax=Methylovirgula ligni TaxID=569860 RepID=A0A3D9YU47_9HYPH|nr:flagellar basal body rod protein FlgB [Methylovirgula ligni]QAY96188.1 flagellar basal body rod protein FlgB [Methylovirgula ligni]REF86116.1 flagellar basal-body rod protein FlgB [Methylovirgula ligni]